MTSELTNFFTDFLTRAHEVTEVFLEDIQTLELREIATVNNGYIQLTEVIHELEQ